MVDFPVLQIEACFRQSPGPTDGRQEGGRSHLRGPTIVSTFRPRAPAHETAPEEARREDSRDAGFLSSNTEREPPAQEEDRTDAGSRAHPNHLHPHSRTVGAPSSRTSSGPVPERRGDSHTDRGRGPRHVRRVGGVTSRVPAKTSTRFRHNTPVRAGGKRREEDGGGSS